MKSPGQELRTQARSHLDRIQNRAWFRYTASLLVAFSAVFLHILFAPVLGQASSYHFAWLAVVVSAWYFGLGPSILTVAIETFSVAYFVLPPPGFRIGSDLPSLSGLAAFLILSGVIVLLGEANRRTVSKRRAAEAQLIAYRDTLEITIDQRTKQLVDANTELSSLSARFLQAQDEERRRIARELHDSAGQLLAALSMSVSHIERRVAGVDPGLTATVAEAQAVVKQLTQEIRTTSYLLHPPLLDEFGLIKALRQYLHEFSERSGLKVELAISEHFERLQPEIELAAFRVVQECLTNVHRHSGSPVATVRLRRENQNISLSIEDRGRGVPASKLAKVKSSGSGVGLSGIRERVRHFGGCMNIDSDESGTRVSITLPLQKKAAESDQPACHATASA